MKDERNGMTNRIDIGHGLALNFTSKADETVPSDVWLQFRGSDGKSAAISVAAAAERTGPIIAGGLRSWASDRINEHLALTGRKD
jgi:hypothetical protein